MMRGFSIPLILFAAASIGCNSEPFERGEVAGTVTFGGQPISKGTITFIPEDSPGASASTEISDGKFKLLKQVGPSVGKHRVEILATREGVKKEAGPPHPPGTMVEVTEQYLPAMYNHQSTLQYDVTAGVNEKNFEL